MAPHKKKCAWSENINLCLFRPGHFPPSVPFLITWVFASLGFCFPQDLVFVFSCRLLFHDLGFCFALIQGLVLLSFSWPGCLLPSDSVSSRPSFSLFFFFFFSLTLSDCFFYELGVCFPSTEFLQDLVFMSVIMDCFFMHLVVASL